MPADGLRGPAGVLVVQRDRRRGGVFAALERPRGRLDALPATGRAERGIGGIADPAVAEVVGVRAVRAEDPAPPQLVQRAMNSCSSSRPRRLAVRGERPPDGRGDAGQRGGLRRQARQPAGDHRLHLRRSRRGIRPQRLDQEQRVALAVFVEAPSPGISSGVPVTCSASSAVSSAAEPGQLDLGKVAERRKGRDQAGERMVLVEFLAAGGGRDEQPGRRGERIR